MNFSFHFTIYFWCYRVIILPSFRRLFKRQGMWIQLQIISSLSLEYSTCLNGIENMNEGKKNQESYAFIFEIELLVEIVMPFEFHPLLKVLCISLCYFTLIKGLYFALWALLPVIDCMSYDTFYSSFVFISICILLDHTVSDYGCKPVKTLYLLV